MQIVCPKEISSLAELSIEEEVLAPFSDILIAFVNDVSRAILKDTFFRTYPELMALAFWMRRSHIEELKEYFQKEQEGKVVIGRGVVFHLAPSNVDTIFVYSWFISLLVGNSNLLRVSDKKNLQMEILLDVIIAVLYRDDYKLLRNRVAIIRYGHEDEITKHLSSMADIRVIWGGDSTIEHIRTIPIKPTATELTFADKFSFAVINSRRLLSDDRVELLIEKFYNDSFWFGQMACSSTRLIAWVGTVTENHEAQELFWNRLNNHVARKQPQEIAPTDIINKLIAQCAMAIENDVLIKASETPYINRVRIQSLDEVNSALHCGTGLFYELALEKFEEIFPFMTKKYQTLSQYGFDREEMVSMLYKNMPKGVDRVVPIGQSLDFSHIWDGYDLFKSFCREIEVI